jgi:predicted membrane metal-binding protein
MPDLPRDDILGRDVALQQGERVLTEFRADRGAYWRNHLILAVLGGALAGGVLLAMGNAAPWVGPVAALLAIGARAAFLASEALAERWLLTDRRLIGPGGRVVPLGTLDRARPFLGDVQLVTRGGDKHLMKYMADAAGTIAAIDRARGAE